MPPQRAALMENGAARRKNSVFRIISHASWYEALPSNLTGH